MGNINRSKGNKSFHVGYTYLVDPHNRSSLVMLLPLLTSLIAVSLIQAKHFLVETENKMTARKIDAVSPVLPKEARKKHKSLHETSVRYIHNCSGRLLHLFTKQIIYRW